MAIFLTTIKYTAKGLEFRGLRQSIERLSTFFAATKSMKLSVIATCWRLDPFDVVVVFEAPDDETAAAVVQPLSADGYIRATIDRLEFPGSQ